MHLEIEDFLYRSEEKYLNAEEILSFKEAISSWQLRLICYEYLREREIAIFQIIADRLVKAFPQEKEIVLEKALKHWISVGRYAAMAMLLNNPEFLKRRLLEWLGPIVQAANLNLIESTICDFLLSRLQEEMEPIHFSLIEPFLEEAKTLLIAEYSLN
jgi:hypothetical protein